MAASPQVTNTKVGDQIRLFNGKARNQHKTACHQNKACHKQFQGFCSKASLASMILPQQKPINV